MDLDQYLSRPDSESMAEFARLLNINADQVRQWRHRTEGRQPSPLMCVRIEAATGNAVMRWDLRPEDWHLIWPELMTRKGAPKVRKTKAAA